MLRLSRDIVSYARPSPLGVQPVILSAVIDQAFAFCEHLFEAAGVRIDRMFGDGVLPVRGRPEQLEQVFVNLFTNGRHAMPDRGQPAVRRSRRSARQNAEHASASSSPTTLSWYRPATTSIRVFQPFFTTEADAQQGGQLGSAIEAHHRVRTAAFVKVDSDATGTRFVLWLPAAAARMRMRTARRARRSRGACARSRVSAATCDARGVRCRPHGFRAIPRRGPERDGGDDPGPRHRERHRAPTEVRTRARLHRRPWCHPAPFGQARASFAHGAAGSLGKRPHAVAREARAAPARSWCSCPASRRCRSSSWRESR